MKKILLSLGSVAAVAAPIVAVVACGSNDSDKVSTTAGVWTAEINGAKFEITGPKDGTNPANLAAGVKDMNTAFNYVPGGTTQAQDATLVTKDGTGDLAGYKATIKSGSVDKTASKLTTVTQLTQTTLPVAEVKPTAGVWKIEINGAKYKITGPKNGTNPLRYGPGDPYDFTPFLTYTAPSGPNKATLVIKQNLSGDAKGYTIVEEAGSSFDGQIADIRSVVPTEESMPDEGSKGTQGVWEANQLSGTTVVITISGPTDGTNPANLPATGNHDISNVLTFTPYVPAGNTPATLTAKKDLSLTDFAGYTIILKEGTFNGKNVDLNNVTLKQTVDPKPAS